MKRGELEKYKTTVVTESEPKINIKYMVLARICTTAVFMVYPATLNVLRQAWDMTATQAGFIQGGFTIAMAVSLFVTSYLSDRFGARCIFHIAALASAAAGLFVAVFARSFETGLAAFILVGITQGATYTPAIMLVSFNAEPHKKNSAVGWVLAGMSAGYVVSIVLSNIMIELFDYRIAFLSVALVSVFGWTFSVWATREAQDPAKADVLSKSPYEPSMRKRSRLLMLGYIGHAWELLGMWAWIPAFMALALANKSAMSGVEVGLWTALALHASGFFASFLAGNAADKYGARPVLLFFAILGCVCSAFMGWLMTLPVAALIAFVAVYGFATIGDSAVLSSAMTDTVPPEYLGKTLGIRSILGFGAGAISPVTFGVVLDAVPGASGWGFGFLSLAFGGFVAILCAIALPGHQPVSNRALS